MSYEDADKGRKGEKNTKHAHRFFLKRVSFWDVIHSYRRTNRPRSVLCLSWSFSLRKQVRGEVEYEVHEDRPIETRTKISERTKNKRQ